MTPEERLLRLIRRHPHHPSPEVPGAAGAPHHPEAKPAESQLEEVPQAQGAGGASVSKGSSPMRKRRVGLLPRALLVISLLNVLSLVGEGFIHRSRLDEIDALLTELPEPSARPSSEEGGMDSTEGLPDSSSSSESYDSVAGDFQGRELFRILAASPTTRAKSDRSVEKQQVVQNRLKELNLLGIVGGPTVQAIIDDAAAKKTYFVKEGDAVADFRVVQISKGKVTVELEGEQHELTL